MGEEAKEDLLVDKEAQEDLLVDEESMEECQVDEEAQEDLPMDEKSLEEFQVNEEAQEDLPLDEEKERVTLLAKWRRLRGWLQAGLAMVAMLCLACHGERLVMGFVAYDCANGTNRVDAYSLLEPAA